MKIKLDNVLKRGGIIFRTHGSEMPCLSFQALRVVYPRKSKVELWYGGEDAQEEVYDYFMEDAETDNIKEAFDEFDGDYSEEELRLMKIKFMSEMAN